VTYPVWGNNSPPTHRSVSQEIANAPVCTHVRISTGWLGSHSVGWNNNNPLSRIAVRPERTLRQVLSRNGAQSRVYDIDVRKRRGFDPCLPQQITSHCAFVVC